MYLICEEILCCKSSCVCLVWSLEASLVDLAVYYCNLFVVHVVLKIRVKSASEWNLEDKSEASSIDILSRFIRMYEKSSAFRCIESLMSMSCETPCKLKVDPVSYQCYLALLCGAWKISELLLLGVEAVCVVFGCNLFVLLFFLPLMTLVVCDGMVSRVLKLVVCSRGSI